jgi:glycerate 2-kinase
LANPRFSEERTLLEQAFAVALGAADAASGVAAALARSSPQTPALVLGAGKAAVSMALAFRAGWQAPLRGLVVTGYGYGLREAEEAAPIDVLEAAHPLPDEQSLTAAQRLLGLARGVRRDETLWFLASGGGSALCALPLPGITLEQKREAADFLIRHGADIRTVNCVRKHLSAIKGGRLAAAAHPAPVRTLVVSDVAGDHLEDVASGPTLADPTSQSDALEILTRYEYPRLPELEPVLGAAEFESPKPSDPSFEHDRAEVVTNASAALDAAHALLAERGFRVLRLGDDLGGTARDLGREHAQLAKRLRRDGGRVAMLSGGETTVVLKAHAGRGGRNLEYLAALALELAGEPGVWALAADTDGIDGRGDHAGGIVAPEILGLGAQRGVALEAALASQDTYRYFETCELLVRTGPTRTNVNDFRLILCQA